MTSSINVAQLIQRDFEDIRLWLRRFHLRGSGCSIDQVFNIQDLLVGCQIGLCRGSQSDPFAVCLDSTEQLTHLRKALYGDDIHACRVPCGIAYVHRKWDPDHHLIHRVLQVRKDRHQLVTPLYRSGGVSAHKESDDQSIGRSLP